MPSRREQDEALEHIARQYLICRELGHHWPDKRPTPHPDNDRLQVRVLTCARCTLTRIDRLDSKYNLTGRSYRYPKGYHLTFRPLGAQLRRVRYVRVVRRR